MFVMAPVFDKINSQALQPYLNEQIPAQEALQKAEVPLKAFMLAQTRTSGWSCSSACPSAPTSAARRRRR